MTTTSGAIAPVNQYLNHETLAVAQPLMLFGELGQKNTIPQKNSLTMAFFRWEKFGSTNGADSSTLRSIIEGQTPEESSPTRTKITCTVAQYGYLQRFSDIVEWVNEIDVDEGVMARNGEDMAEGMEKVYRDGISGGTTAYRFTNGVGGVSGSLRSDVAGRVNPVGLDQMVAFLRRNVAKYYTKGIKAGSGEGTIGIREGYIAVTHTDVEPDLTNMPRFITPEKYAGGSQYPGEQGAYGRVRICTSTLSKVWQDSGAASTGGKSNLGTNADVYALYMFGQEAYAVVDLASTSDIYYIPQSAKDKSDPLCQISTLGWKASGGSVILNDLWFARGEIIVSAAA